MVTALNTREGEVAIMKLAEPFGTRSFDPIHVALEVTRCELFERLSGGHAFCWGYGFIR